MTKATSGRMRAVARARRAARRGAQSERGSALVLCLVIITVVALTSTATMKLQTTSYTVQKQFTEKHTEEVDADSAIDAAIDLIRSRPLYGTVGGGSAMYIPTADAACDKYKTTTLDAGDALATINGIDVRCAAATADSGLPTGLTPAAGPYAILTTGGQAARGDHELVVTTADDTIPFCDDWHPNNNNNQCEAGIYIGPGTDSSEGGGLIVQPTGSAAVLPLVHSNSSIIVNNNEAGRALKVGGGVEARYACTTTHIIAAWSEVTPQGNAAQRSCPTDVVPTRELHFDHALDALSESQGAVAPENIDYHDYTDSPGELVEALPDRSSMDSVKNPAYWLQNQSMWFQSCPIRSLMPGRYTDVAQLNTFFTQCANPGPVIHFQPGVYYFDWDSTTPLGSPSNGAQIVGGTPNGWTFSASGAAQSKTMYPDDKTQTPTNWNDDAFEVALGRPDNNPSDVRLGRKVDTGEQALGASLQLGRFETPMPAGMLGVGGKLYLDIAHMAPSVTTGSGQHLKGYADGYPRVEISVPESSINQKCIITLTRPQQIWTSAAAPATPAIVEPQIDLTNGCPASPGGGRTRVNNFSGFTAWSGELVNKIKVEYVVRRTGDDVEITAGLDGMQLRVNYTGLPAPSFPGGCKTNAAGVQLIFGSTARINWGSHDFTAEFCGSQRAGDPYGAVIYGLPGVEPTHPDEAPHAVPQPVMRRSTPTGSTALPSTQPATVAPILGTDVAQLGLVQDYPAPFLKTAIDPVTGLATGTTSTPSAADLDAADNVGVTVNNWTGPGTYTAGIKLPMDFVPEGSTIERVQLHVCHNEPYGNFAKVFMTAKAGNSGGGGTAWSTEFAASNVKADDKPKLAQGTDGAGPLGQPISCDGDDDANNDGTPDDPTEFIIGRYIDPNNPAQLNPDWNTERWLTDSLDTPAKLNGAEFSYNANSGDTTTTARGMNLEYIGVTVEYRPPGSLRPIRGCLTTRAATNPDAAQMHGVDRDWGAVLANGVYKPDSAYTTSAAGGAGNTDAGSCPLLRTEDGVRFHIEGSVYAPTAAIDLRGVDNDAAFVTGGVVVRHLTAWRWKKGTGLAAFGGVQIDRNDRVVTIEARKNGKLIATAKVRFSDYNGYDVGEAAVVLAYRRRDGYTL